jgi:glutamate synthase domain-containing protein 2
VQLRFRVIGGKSRGKKKSAYEDLTCDVKTLSELQCSDIRSACAVERRIGTSAMQFGAVSEW